MVGRAAVEVAALRGAADAACSAVEEDRMVAIFAEHIGEQEVRVNSTA